MKKLLLMTVALIALGATMAAAQDGTMNLSWGTLCRTAANNATASVNDLPNTVGGVLCSDITDPFNPGGPGHRFVTASLKNTVNFTTFAGCAVLIEVLADADIGPTPSVFWSMGNPEGVNAGAMAVKTAIGSINSGCSTPYAGDAQTIIGDIHERVDPVTKRIRISYNGSRVRSNTQFNLGVASGAGGWVAEQMDIDFTNATAGGCQVPVCFNLNQIQYGGGAVNFFVTTAELRNWVTYAGGTGDCPGATPTKNATWGSVKALYR